MGTDRQSSGEGNAGERKTSTVEGARGGSGAAAELGNGPAKTQAPRPHLDGQACIIQPSSRLRSPAKGPHNP